MSFPRLHPAQLVVWGFTATIAAGTALLLLPVARAGGGGAPLMTALFTSTSAVCVTGLTVVDTATYWSGFGQVAIMVLIQVGGFGIMALASLLALLVVRRLRLRTRLLAQFETAAPELGDIRQVLLGVASLSLLFESAAATLIAARLYLHYDVAPGEAAWQGVFHAVSSFNNAGFALYSDNLIGFVGDAWILLTLAVAIVAGGLGFPVFLELRRLWRSPRRWSLHTKLTLTTTAFLLAFGTLAMLAFEWRNDATLGGLPLTDRLLSAFFDGGVTPRTAGFNTIDFGAVRDETLLVSDMLMFVGGGSASTAGGIKVTTFALLALIVLAELRGDRHVSAFSRLIPAHAHRQAFAVAFIALNAVVIGTLALMAVSDFRLYECLFEAVSAFGTVGLSTGITADFGTAGRSILIALMFLGRIGPHTLGVALVLRERERLYRHAEERPIVG